MKQILTGCLFIFVFTSAINSIQAQNLDLSGLELVAHYELLTDGSDITGNYDSMGLVKPIFDEKGLFCRGCYTGFGIDSCVIITPNIDDLGKERFVVQVDFYPLSFPGFNPVFSIGEQSRALAYQTDSEGALILLTNNSNNDTISGLQIDTAVWYNAAILHDRSDSTTQVFLNDQLIYTKKAYLNFRVGTVRAEYQISSSNFGYGRAFHGYWQNLKVYTVGESTSAKDLDEDEPIILYPNPVEDVLYINSVTGLDLKYTVLNAQGAIIKNGNLVDQSISVSGLGSGVYLLNLFEENPT